MTLSDLITRKQQQREEQQKSQPLPSYLKPIDREKGLGQLHLIDDHLLINLLIPCFTIPEICQLGLISRTWLVLSEDDRLWKQFTLNRFLGDFWFEISWKYTYVHNIYLCRQLLAQQQQQLEQQEGELQHQDLQQEQVEKLRQLKHRLTTTTDTVVTIPDNKNSDGNAGNNNDNVSDHKNTDNKNTDNNNNNNNTLSSSSLLTSFKTAPPLVPSNPFKGQTHSLYAKWSRSNFDMNQLIIPFSHLDRRNCMTLDQFIQEYGSIQKPVIITDAMNDWKAFKDFKRDNKEYKDFLLHEYGDIAFKTDAMWMADWPHWSPLYRQYVELDRKESVLEQRKKPSQQLREMMDRQHQTIRMPLRMYMHYMQHNRDEEPIYLFDGKFGERAPGLLEDYKVPMYFQEDFFEQCLPQDKRPDFRWLVMGPKRSGSSWHMDPYMTSAWNALICGAKRWAFYPQGYLSSDLKELVDDAMRDKQREIEEGYTSDSSDGSTGSDVGQDGHSSNGGNSSSSSGDASASTSGNNSSGTSSSSHESGAQNGAQSEDTTRGTKRLEAQFEELAAKKRKLTKSDPDRVRAPPLPNYLPCSEPLEWLTEEYLDACQENFRPWECMQYPGEVLFVPSGWWHMVLNVDDTIAVTQNFVNTQNFAAVFPDIQKRDKNMADALRKGLLEKNRHDLFWFEHMQQQQQQQQSQLNGSSDGITADTDGDVHMN